MVDAVAVNVRGVRAPFDGVAGEKMVSIGQFVKLGDPLIQVISVNPIDLQMDIPERYLSSIKIGQTVEFEGDAYPGATFSGTVTYIAPSVSSASRTVRVKAVVKNDAGKLKPGMFGRVKLILESRGKALMIPETAISVSRAGSMVIDVDDKGIAGFRPVTTGERIKGRVEITKGLSAGEVVVIEGGQKLGPGSPVMAAPESAQYGVTPGPIGQQEKEEPSGSN